MTPFWRTVDEQADDPSFQERLVNEFPSEIETLADPVARRQFLKVMGASLALAGFTACTRQPAEKIVPYVRQPEEIIPGRPLFYATAMAIGGVATGLLVESHEGRPTKIEGNPLHPGSLGAADVFAQAAVLDLYDPDRSRTVTNLGEIRPWPALLAAIRAAALTDQPLGGAGIRLLTPSVSSPTLAWQIQDVLRRFPNSKWHQWDAAGREHAKSGAMLAFGERVETQYRLDQADVIFGLDTDFLASGAGSLRYARDFAARRRPEPADRMNRLYVVETMPTPTGSRADHRFPARPSEIPLIAQSTAAAIVEGLRPLPNRLGEAWGPRIEHIARDLMNHRGSSLVVAGDTQPPVVHALAHAMNQTLGNVGRTVVYTEPVEASAVDQLQSLRDLVADMNAGTVNLLLILGGNPVYTAPVDVGFGAALDRVQLRVHLARNDDETSALCHWHVPEAHFLETWSDARGYDGTASIVQPLIAPLYGARSAHELVAALTERPEEPPYEIVRQFWRRERPSPDRSSNRARNGTRRPAPAPAQAVGTVPNLDPEFERTWRRWLHDGVLAGTAFPPRTVSVNLGAVRAAASALASEDGVELAFRLDPTTLDGRFSNNGWLQELPKPITKLAWDNAVIVSPAMADRLKAAGRPAFQAGEHGQIVSDVVEITYRGRRLRGPIFAVAGHPDECVTLHLGYGRTRAGHVGTGAGFNANVLRLSEALWSDGGVALNPTGDRFSLACTQYHHLMEGRDLVRAVTRDEFVRDPGSAREGDETPSRTITLYPDYRYEGYKWGMAIDINACVGCNACVVGCQAENNIPVVGKSEVLRGREMHWLRIDTYHRGRLDNPETYFQPVPCMQCENAPCEVVCPVGATVHSHEGLNDMVYNRCVGTRYCSNNCPYKVRRFNFLLYQDWDTPSLKLGRNPDVTVRSRGVMEKCTYCVQRINAAKIAAEKQDRPIGRDEIRTACQQACPAEAIVFGDLNDPGSRVARLQAEARSYALLGELNTRPRTTYLAAVRNPNPELSE